MSDETGIVRAGKSWDNEELVREDRLIEMHKAYVERMKSEKPHPYIYANENVEDEPASGLSDEFVKQYYDNGLTGKVFRTPPECLTAREPTQAEKCGRGEHEEDAGIDTGLLVEYSNTANARVEVCQHCRVLYVAK